MPEWSPSERDEILINHDVKPHKIHADVAKSLLNPRLLGIAVELLSQDEIMALEELSVGRLLFAHILTSERDSPIPQPALEFKGKLIKHAQRIIERMQNHQVDDLTVFEADLHAVAEGRFFLPLEGDPEKYQLIDDGLTLALALAVIDRFRSAKRNQRNLDESLAKILEPISALDVVAKVVLDALTVTVIDKKQYEPEFTAALIKGFANLQNPNSSKYPVFLRLMQTQPLPFMKATADLCLEEVPQHNFDWLKYAVIESSKVNHVWIIIENIILDWLSFHSLSPEIGMLPIQKRGTAEDINAKKEKILDEINTKLSKLSESEKHILNRLKLKDADCTRLHRLALMTLASKPLCSFVESLINWSFSARLNFSWGASNHEEFKHLISFNKVDWQETRENLRKSSKHHFTHDVSSTGKWALVTILNATGESTDAVEAEQLVSELTKDRDKHPGWRLIEDYCANDPCDPDSTEPENIAQTAEKYLAMDVNQWQLMMGQTAEDHFFADTRLGMARFRLDDAVQKHLAFAENILTRRGLPLRQGIFELCKHEVLLTKAFADDLVALWKQAKLNKMFADLGDEQTYFSLVLLQTVFPLFSAAEQLEILALIEDVDHIPLQIFDRIHTIDAAKFEYHLKSAIDNQNENKQFLLLGLAHRANVNLSPNAQILIRTFMGVDSECIQTELLGIAASGNDPELLSFLVKKGWCAEQIQNDKRGLTWLGSMALLQAAKMDLIDHISVLDRVSPSTYGQAANMLNIEAKQEIGRRLDVSIKKVMGLQDELTIPNIAIQLHMPTDNADAPFRVSLTQKQTHATSTQDLLENANFEKFYAQQACNRQAFEAFKQNLSFSNASIVLDGFNLEGFALIVSVNEALADNWFNCFMNLPEGRLNFLHNLVLLLAYAFNTKQPAKAIELFSLVRDSQPTIRFTFGAAGIELNSIAVWASLNQELDAERTYRLDSATNDHALAQEVLAALTYGQQAFLEGYISKKLERKAPAEIARGIMVAGFSDVSDFNTNVLLRYEKNAGFIGIACKAAKYAYVRNIWARHWYEVMCNTNNRHQFWQALMLYNKIVDGRFEVWQDEYQFQDEFISIYSPASDKLKNRFDHWKNHREKMLFGSPAPNPIFII